MIDFNKLLDSKEIKFLCQNIETEKKQIAFNLPADSKAIVLGMQKKQFVFVVKDLVTASRFAEQLSVFDFKTRFLFTTFQNSVGLIDAVVRADFYSAVFEFCQGELDGLIVTSDSLFQKVASYKSLIKNVWTFEKGKSYTFKEFLHFFLDSGYSRVEKVSSRGQFSLRGDILEVFPINKDGIIRIEFFDTEVEKITFLTQERKFISSLDQVKILGINQNDDGGNLLSFCEEFSKHENKKIILSFDEPLQLEKLAMLFVKSNFVKGNNLDKNLNNKDEQKINKNEDENNEKYVEFENEKYFSEFFVYPNQIFQSKLKCQIAFSNITAKTFFDANEIVVFRTIATKKYVHDFSLLAKDIFLQQGFGKNVFLFCGEEKNLTRLDDFLKSKMIFSQKVKTLQQVNFDAREKNVFLVEAFLPFSFAFAETDSYIIGTNDLFKKKAKASEKKSQSPLYIPKVNDYVVHETHGVGKCVAVQKMNLVGAEKDYFVIEYAGGDRFLLPSENADSISAFYGGDKFPRLNKLGGADFSKVKAKVYASVKKLAIDLIALYAKRENSKGFVYKKDDYLMQLFEDAFPYEETPDQLHAINDIKSDMESTRIMDRLVCGDVGYGKTEVALRAIYKAVLSGKQVAFLCPTTILAEQHYKTCKKRFSGFMVRLARLNRLVPASEQEQTLQGLKNGEINVVCGTHKLLSKNVQFKNLGLLVLDEEQRFGVEDKEKIKQMKENVDVLTLSATPIPRTLHMSLTGIRDISIIDTPPKERIPVQTFVTPFSEKLLVSAVQNEINRGGQVLIVFNRVEFIYQFAAMVSSLLPKARIGVAHGQLKQSELEKVIMNLYNGEYDILVATTLIENGVDLPTANTLIIIDADKLGLSALYQLRGRIGRNDQVAYAYFTYDENKTLTEGAFKRLDAIMEFTQLGSGFKIAMRDLEIRGAGNVLGKEQHGSMQKVGYDLYCKLLSDAVHELKGEKLEKRGELRVDVDINAFISEDYISDEMERVKKYTQISSLKTKKELIQFEQDLEKSFGKPPQEAINLLHIALLKNLLITYNVKRVQITSDKFSLYFPPLTTEYKTQQTLDDDCTTQTSILNLSQKLSQNNIPHTIPTKTEIRLGLTVSNTLAKLQTLINLLG